MDLATAESIISQQSNVLKHCSDRISILMNENQLKQSEIDTFSIQMDAIKKLHGVELGDVNAKLDKCTSFIKSLKEDHDNLKIENTDLKRQIKNCDCKPQKEVAEKNANVKGVQLSNTQNCIIQDSRNVCEQENIQIENEMTPDAAKLKLKNFLTTLLSYSSTQPGDVARTVQALIQVYLFVDRYFLNRLLIVIQFFWPLSF